LNEQEVRRILNIVFFHRLKHPHTHSRVSQNPMMPTAPLLSFVRWPKYQCRS